MDLRGHYLNRRDQEERDHVFAFLSFDEVLTRLIELLTTLSCEQEPT